MEESDKNQEISSDKRRSWRKDVCRVVLLKSLDRSFEDNA